MATCSRACPHVPCSTTLHSTRGLAQGCLGVETQNLWWGLTYQLWKGWPRPVPMWRACRYSRGASISCLVHCPSSQGGICFPSALLMSTCRFWYPSASFRSHPHRAHSLRWCKAGPGNHFQCKKQCNQFNNQCFSPDTRMSWVSISFSTCPWVPAQDTHYSANVLKLPYVRAVRHHQTWKQIIALLNKC